MNWSLILIGFCLAVVTGAIAATTLARMRPDWSARRRLLTAAAILPGFTALGALVAIILIWRSGSGDEMRDLALAAVATIGGVATLLALIGGLIGAALRQVGMRR